MITTPLKKGDIIYYVSYHRGYKIEELTVKDDGGSIIHFEKRDDSKRQIPCLLFSEYDALFNSKSDAEFFLIEEELRNAKYRQHIIVGLKTIIPNLENVVYITRSSENWKSAKKKIKKMFGLTDEQISQLTKFSLSQLNIENLKNLDDEYEQIESKIKYLQAVLRTKNEAITKE